MKEITVGHIGAGKETAIEILVEQTEQQIVPLDAPEPTIIKKRPEPEIVPNFLKYTPVTHKSRSGNKGNKKQSKARAKSKRARKARKK